MGGTLCRPCVRRSNANESNTGAPGRIRTCVGLRPTDLQSVVIDHSTTDALNTPLRLSEDAFTNNTEKKIYVYKIIYYFLESIYI